MDLGTFLEDAATRWLKQYPSLKGLLDWKALLEEPYLSMLRRNTPDRDWVAADRLKPSFLSYGAAYVVFDKYMTDHHYEAYEACFLKPEDVKPVGLNFLGRL